MLNEVFFSDNLSKSPEYYDGLAMSPCGSLRQYFQENSLGKMNLSGEVFDFSAVASYLQNGSACNGWYFPNSLFAQDEYNETENVKALARQALEDLCRDTATETRLAALDNTDEWDSSQSNDGLFTNPSYPQSERFDCVIFLVIVPESCYMGGGMGWFIKDMSGMSIDGSNVRSIILSEVVLSYDSTNQTGFKLDLTLSHLTHEIGHAMGLPDNYDRFALWPSPMAICDLKLMYYSYPYNLPDIDKIIQKNYSIYCGKNQFITHYCGYEKALLGWIDEIHYTGGSIEHVDLYSIYQQDLGANQHNLLVIPITGDSELYNDWHLFTGNGVEPAPDDIFLLLENRGYCLNTCFENNILNHGLYGFLVDTTRAGAYLPTYTNNTNYHNFYRPLRFDCCSISSPLGWGSFLRAENINTVGYLTPFTGPVNRNSIIEKALPDDGPCIHVNMPLTDDGSNEIDHDMPIGVDIYPSNPFKIFLDEVRVEHLWSEAAGEYYNFRTRFWDSEFSHSWPEGDDGYIPDFTCTLTRLLEQDGEADPAFTPISSSDYAGFLAINGTIDELLDGCVPGRYYFNIEVVNNCPRNSQDPPVERPDVDCRASIQFPLNFEEALVIDEGTPITLDFDNDSIRNLFSSEASGEFGSCWQYIFDVDTNCTVAYCGRTGLNDAIQGYEPNLDLELTLDVPLEIIDSGANQYISLSIKHELEKSIPNDSDNWDAIGLDELGVNVEGDHLHVEIGRYPLSENESTSVDLEFILEPSGSSVDYSTYFCILERSKLEPLGILNDEIDPVILSQLRFRFTSDDSMQFDGVFISEIVLGAL